MSLNIDGSCSFSVPSIGGGPLGCTGCTIPPTTTPVPCADILDIHFDQYETGDTVLVFPGFTLSTNSASNPLMIFDSAAPTVGQEALGTPNIASGGPGIGAGGSTNVIPQMKTLIISANPPTPLAPVSNPSGGLVTFEFNETISVSEIHLINVTSASDINTYDISNTVIYNTSALPFGANSFQVVTLVGDGVRKLTIQLQNDASIAHVIYRQCKNPAIPCVELTCENWNSFTDGTNSSASDIVFPDGTVTSSLPGTNAAMIFNASIPTAGDTYLGTPNVGATPPGPGIGAGGTPGTVGENILDLSKVLIISEDNSAATPKANAGGQYIFTFTNPVRIAGINLLNVDTDGSNVKLYNTSGNPIELVNIPNLGANSFQKVAITAPYSTKVMVVNITGKAAIAQVCYYKCGSSGGVAPMPDMIVLPDNMMTQVPIPSTALQGTFMLIVKSINVDGASATFVASKGYNAQPAGSIARLTSAPSLTDETVHIMWNGSSNITLFHDTLKTAGTGALLPYNVQIFTI